MSEDINSKPSAAFESKLLNAPTGLVGTLHVQIIRDTDQVVISPRTTAGIVESPLLSGRYVFTGTAPAASGRYTVLWDKGSVTPENTAGDTLVVTFTGIESVPGATILTPSEYEILRGSEKSVTLQQLELVLPWIDDIINKYCNRDFTSDPVTETRQYLYEGSGIQDIDDCTNITSVVLNSETVLEADGQYQPMPMRGPVFEYLDLGPHLPFWFLAGSPEMGFTSNRDVLFYESLNWGSALPRALQRRFNFLEVTASFGWPPGSLPLSLKQAAAWLTDEMLTTDAESKGLTGESIGGVSYQYLNDSPTTGPAVLAPRVRTLLDVFRRPEL